MCNCAAWVFYFSAASQKLVCLRRKRCDVKNTASSGQRADAVNERLKSSDIRRLAAVVIDSNDAITVQDLEGKISAWNRGAERMYGYTELEARAMNIQDTIPSAKRQEALEFIAAVAALAPAAPSFETQRVTKDGRTLDVWLTVTVLVDEAGKPVGIATTERDITERKRAEEVRKQLITQLKSANKELESFAYAVSHDLKAPLRGIDSLAGWIAEDCKDQLDEEGKKQFEMLQTRARRMHALIDGILEYSRIGRVWEDVVELDLNKVLADIVELLQPPPYIRIEVQKSLPIVKCEKVRIHQVFQNLLSNAIKYVDKPQGVVKVGCEEDGVFWRFSVNDNGSGIDEKYHERIFGLFQTLGSTKQSESTGVGLSLVKKIVEQYGGKVWLKSKLGQGSTFYFTLAKKPVEMKEGRQ